jgi:hypothetical protein
MLLPSSTHSLLLPQAPPFALRRGLRCAIANLLAQLRGSRDVGQPFGPDGLQPAVAGWHRQVDQIAARIDDALSFRLNELDRRIAELVGRARQHESAIHDLSDTLVNALTEHHDEHSVAASDNRRLISRTRVALDVERQALALTGREILQLAQAHQHLREAAGDIADSWSRRCDELTAFHRRGLHLRRLRTEVGDPESDPPLAGHRVDYDWARSLVPGSR